MVSLRWLKLSACILIPWLIFLAACTPPPKPVILDQATITETVREGQLTPFLTRTPSSTPAPRNLTAPTQLPPPTATPRTHVVQRGELLGGIALRYGVSLEALKAANPKVNPNFLIIGAVLVIPGSSPTQVPAEGAATPTPLPLGLDPVNCIPDAAGGAWCFTQVRNRQKTAVDSVSVQIRIAGQKDGETISLTAFPLINRVEAGSVLPVGVYFPAPIAKNISAGAEILTALPVADDDPRYVALKVENFQFSVDAKGLSAVVSGNLVVGTKKGRSGQAWVLSAVYNELGEVIGLRRWESSEPIKTGAKAAFSDVVYSTGGKIVKAAIFIEGVP
jgi:LysM repeat protein